MRKLFCCVLTISLLLTACGGGGGNEGEELALKLRGEYLAAGHITGTAAITADYGQRVYRCEAEFDWNEEECVLRLTAPERIAGITARLSKTSGGLLEYDGAVLETGPLTQDGLTPLEAVPTLLRTLREDYLDSCVLEQREQGAVLRLLCRQPELERGTGIETTLWLDAESGALLRGEISRDGFCVLQCEFSTFTKETG